MNAPCYRNLLNLSRRIDRYVDKLVQFNGMNSSGKGIEREEITARILDIVIPKRSGTTAQEDAIKRSTDRARRLNIYIYINRY